MTISPRKSVAKAILCLALMGSADAFRIQYQTSPRWAPRSAAARKSTAAVTTMKASPTDKLGAATAAGLILAVRVVHIFSLFVST